MIIKFGLNVAICQSQLENINDNIKIFAIDFLYTEIGWPSRTSRIFMHVYFDELWYHVIEPHDVTFSYPLYRRYRRKIADTFNLLPLNRIFVEDFKQIMQIGKKGRIDPSPFKSEITAKVNWLLCWMMKRTLVTLFDKIVKCA